MRLAFLLPLLLLTALPGCATTDLPGAAGAAILEPRRTEATVETPDGRSVVLEIVEAADPRGVVVFSHGANAPIGPYAGLHDVWASNGWTVVSPVHVDSRDHPNRGDYSLQEAYPLRLADSRAAAAHARTLEGDLPLIAAGHSYGSLMAAAAGGALRQRGGVPIEGVEMVLMLSSPGKIPGLITKTAYATLDMPLLVITGTEDVVPGFVPDPSAHLYAYETAGTAERTLVVIEGADHYLGIVDGGEGPGRALIERVTLDAFAAYAGKDGAARARLGATTSAMAEISRP